MDEPADAPNVEGLHTGLPVPGYQPQSDADIAVVADNKRLEERVLRMIDAHMCINGYDKRWIAIAQTHFQQGFMALNRAVFRPARISLPEDK